MKSNNTTTIVIVLFIIGLSVVGTAGYFAYNKMLQIRVTPELSPKPSNLPNIVPGIKTLQYDDSNYGFQLYYPQDSDVRSGYLEGYLPVTQNAAVGIFLSQSLFNGTNLGEAAVLVGINPSAKSLTQCNTLVPDLEENRLGIVNINGIDFHAFSSTGVGAGNIYETKSYRLIHNNSCYEIVEFLHSGSIYNYTPGTVKEFDKARFSKILDNMVQSFVFTRSNSGIIGLINSGPTCPVERIPPDPKCALRPLKTTIKITRSDNSSFIKQIDSDLDGRFILGLEPGSYTFSAESSNSLPRCSPVNIEIKSQNYLYLNISCDTGIR